MPDREFLEKYALYRKFNMAVPKTWDGLAKPAIHLYCPVCKSDQTFNMTNEYYEGFPNGPEPMYGGDVTVVVYGCAACQDYSRYFFLKLDHKAGYVMKVGQEPRWEPPSDPTLGDMLGDYAEYYKKGWTCEAQGYGIGAFSYYRRVIEKIIGQLLTGLQESLSETDRQLYGEGLEKARKAKATEKKIELVAEVLPPGLALRGMNPLTALHKALSKGLHAQSDEECLELAATVHQVLLFLVKQITASKEEQRNLTAKMRKLLAS